MAGFIFAWLVLLGSFASIQVLRSRSIVAWLLALLLRDLLHRDGSEQ